jgi:hypothetical protein
MYRGLFKSLEKGVERRLGEHVDLVYYIHLIASQLRRYAHLFIE